MVSDMALYKFFSCNVEVQYKGYFLSKAMLFTFVTTLLTIILPFLVGYRSRGFWLRSHSFHEKPVVHFNYEYLLVIETDDPSQPIICQDGIQSSDYGEEYCAEFNVEDTPCTNEDKTCSLIFNAKINIPPERTVTSMFAILGLQVKFSTVCPLHMQNLAVVSQDFASSPSTYKYLGELHFHQVEHLPCYKNIIDTKYNATSLVIPSESRQNTLDIILGNYFKRHALTVTKPLYSRSQYGHTGSMDVNININIPEMVVKYTPSFMQELKWAWPQYLSLAVIFHWIFNKIRRFVFNNRLLMAWEVVPWKRR